jgi:hypothetical protein
MLRKILVHFWIKINGLNKQEKNRENVGKKPENYQKIPEKSNSCFLTSENSFRVFRGSFGNFLNKSATILTHFTE